MTKVENNKENVKAREKIIKDFFAKWISENLEKRVWNDDLQDFIHVRFLSIQETAEKAARQQKSTDAVIRLTDGLKYSKLISEVPVKQGNQNKKPFSKMLIMHHNGIKLTIGVQKSTGNKILYCITAI